jgi:hypothetical protein
MLGRKTGYHHNSFQKINSDIHTFAKKNEHFNKNTKSMTSSSQSSSEPKKSQFEK